MRFSSFYVTLGLALLALSAPLDDDNAGVRLSYSFKTTVIVKLTMLSRLSKLGLAREAPAAKVAKVAQVERALLQKSGPAR